MAQSFKPTADIGDIKLTTAQRDRLQQKLADVFTRYVGECVRLNFPVTQLEGVRYLKMLPIPVKSLEQCFKDAGYAPILLLSDNQTLLDGLVDKKRRQL